jgi:hypothetical protein
MRVYIIDQKDSLGSILKKCERLPRGDLLLFSQKSPNLTFRLGYD